MHVHRKFSYNNSCARQTADRSLTEKPIDRFFVPQACPAARTRLFCIPYAGSWPWAFRAWPAGLSDVEVCVCYLPGRGNPLMDSASSCMGSFVAALRNAMVPLLNKPYAIFGHSLGALIAYELAGELERAGNLRPLRLFVSGCPAPARQALRPSLHELSDDRLISILREWDGTPAAVLENPELLRMTLTLIRADLKLARGQGMPTVAVECPMTAFFGTADSEASRADVMEWRGHARGPFDVCDFPGGHFFIHTHVERVLGTLQHYLRNTSTAL